MKLLKACLPSVALCAAMAAIGGSALAQDDVVVVRGTLVPDEKKSTPEISSLLDAEAFERIGDGDIAGALRRVTGISITGGKFPVARGLNERYSAVTLNGVPIPSAEPLRRAAPLDIIPTDILSGSLAQKTFSPQFSGEFGGAAIDLQTIKIPDEDFLSIGVGLELDTISTLRNGYFYEGSDTDFLGFDDGLRDVPGAAAATIANGVPADQTALDLSFDQKDTLLITSEDVPASGSASISFGKVFELDSGLRIGSTTYVGYDNQWEVRQGEADRLDQFASGVFDQNEQFRFDFEETRQNIKINALNTTGFETASGDHEVALTTYILRDTLKRARIATDFLDTRNIGTDPLRVENTDWLERQTWQAQLSGDHLFPELGDLEAAWRVSYGEADRDAPYERRTLRQLEPSTNEFRYFNEGSQSNTMVFSEIQDENFYAGLDFTLPLMVGDIDATVKFGGAYTDSSRETQRSVFTFDSNGNLDAQLSPSRIDLIYSDAVLSTDVLDIVYISNSPREPDLSNGALEVSAAYVMTEVEFNEFLRGSLGVRYEEGTQSASTEVISRPGSLQSFDDIEEEYFLPAATITWNPVGQVQLRAGYSKTIARPQFRELVFTNFQDLDFDATLRGNPLLQNSELDNYDARLEWYFGRNQFVTIGAFYKDIQNPIEQYQVSGEDDAFSFVNVPSAELYGMEFEFEKRFDLEGIIDAPWAYGTEFLFLTNYTWSDSEVQTSGDIANTVSPGASGPVANQTVTFDDLVTDGRQLVGQSEHLFNLQLGLENPDSGTKVTALLNYASERILFAESGSSPNAKPAVLEQPPLSLDLVVSQDITLGEGVYGLGVKVQNLLGEEYDTFREDAAGESRPFLTYDRGTKFSVSLSRDF